MAPKPYEVKSRVHMFQIDEIGAANGPMVQPTDTLGSVQIGNDDENLSEPQAAVDNDTLGQIGEYCLVNANRM